VGAVALWGALLALSGCTGTGEESKGGEVALEQTWIAEIVKHPDDFATRISTTREGWQALHRNDWPAAVAAGGDPAARAHAELARFYRMLAALDTEAWARTGNTWRRRGDLPVGSLLPWLVGAALADAGRDEEASTWPGGASTIETVAARKRLHDAVRAGSEPVSSLGGGATALVSETGSDGGRTFADPWLVRTYAAAEARAADAQAPLDRDLFSGRLGAPLELPERAEDSTVDGDACRERVRTLDGELDAWRAGVGGSLPAEGRQLLDELRLVEGARARALTDLAIAALDAERPACALALSQMAIDYESPRTVGPVNSPTLFAVVARALLHTGRTREALDAVEVLRKKWPELSGLDETLSTLVVLEGMDRSGDSRE
jgi:hypothetical protein